MSRKKRFFGTRQEYHRAYYAAHKDKFEAYRSQRRRHSRPGRPAGHNRARDEASSSIRLCGCGREIPVRYGYARGHSPEDFH